MFGSWFAKAPHDPTDAEDDEGAIAGPSSKPLYRPFPLAPKATNPFEFRTPHDDALEQLDAEHPELGMLNKGPPLDLEFPLPAGVDPKDVPARGTSPDTLYDPFSGLPVGSFALQPHGDPHGSGDSYFPDGVGLGTSLGGSAPAGSASFDGARSALWAHLARVRALQAHVADAHVALEGAALGERPGAAPAGARRMSSTVGVPGAGRRRASATLDREDVDEDAERRREREDEFGRLPGRLAGRAEAVEDIMHKVRAAPPAHAPAERVPSSTSSGRRSRRFTRCPRLRVHSPRRPRHPAQMRARSPRWRSPRGSPRPALASTRPPRYQSAC
jgi:hypothetical protein